MPTFQGFDFPAANLQNASLEELRAYVMSLQDALAKMQRDQKYYMNNMDTDNITEVGGWRLTPTELKSKDGDVGMSTEDTPADDIRFFSGAVGGNKETSPFKVRESGKMEATGATIQSATGYPKVMFDPEGNLFAAYTDPNNYVALIPNHNGAPAYAVFESGLVRLLIQYISGELVLFAPTGLAISVTSGDITLQTTGGNTRVSSWSQFVNATTNRTLQQDLNAKANGSGVTGNFATSDGKTVFVQNGIITAIA